MVAAVGSGAPSTLHALAARGDAMAAALVLRAVAPDLWEDLGGLLLLGGVVGLLAVATRLPAKRG